VCQAATKKRRVYLDILLFQGLAYMSSTPFSFNLFLARSMSYPETFARSGGKKDSHVECLEQVGTHSPPSKMEKGQPITQIVTNGPDVHEKVRYETRLEFQPFLTLSRCHGGSS
jgi:hypothetical protein